MDSSPVLASPGVGSQLDVGTIITKLMTVESVPLTQLQAKEAGLNANLSAFGQLNSAFSTFTNALQAAALSSTYKSMQATASNIAVLSVSAGTSAQDGTHSLNVTSIAQAQSVASNDFSSDTQTIGTGTLTIQFGTFTAKSGSTPASFVPNASTTAQTITIDSAHQTLAGVRDAINAANAGVTASIVNDGSGSRLVVTSNSTGTANSIKISAADGTGAPLATNTGLGQLAYDPTSSSSQNVAQTVAPKDAVFTLDGIAITKSSNTVTDVLQGVSLNLQATGSTNVTIAKNTAGIDAAVQNFVNAYNTVNQTVRSLTAYNANTQTAAQLNGDATATMIQRKLPMILTSAIEGWTGSIRSLSDVGVAFQKDGTLTLDTSKLNDAIQNHFSDVAGLFATNGTATDSQVAFNTFSDKTQPGTYAVHVDSLATQGIALGKDNLSGGATITAGVNDMLNLTVDGHAATVKLVPGAYTSGSQLAAELQSQINGTTALVNAGAAVSVNVDGSGHLSITSKTYGASSQVNVTGGDAVTTLFGGATSTQGTATAATSGNATGSVDMSAGTTITSGSNDTLAVSVDGQTAATPVTLTAGTYTGAALATEIQTQINSAFPTPGVTVNLDSSGHLVVTSNSTGVTSQVQITGGTALTPLFGTVTSTGGTSAQATSGSVSGNADVSSGVNITTGSNDTLGVTLDGQTSQVTLAAGSYTSAQLATQLQTQINSNSTFANAGLSATVSVDGSGHLWITSNSTGTASQVQVSGNAVTTLFGGPGSTQGTDVKGSINGVAATGSGQFLLAAPTDASAGLSIQITGGAAGAGAAGDRGTVSFSNGVAAQLLNFANQVTNPSTGLIVNRENGINASLTELNKRIDSENLHLAAVQAAYTAQFNSLDTLLGSMTATSNFLTQQLSSLPLANSKSSGG